ncbi:ras association domain-containing protein 4 isoform X1 [Diachasma alloeum]|uniref:ras association domain-containing protein 4 isoform X1 n=1 Tax=Diachasma alloeum TaxID=454923 RepID=UPI00073828DE|nr:ras association domain-containing protein 4 isoform X1 [Diachasma alloeum]XP_015116578.1 ras association domain-containing protein 4 isoform X1 [Diachasma alloeum]
MWKCHKCGKPVYFAERKQSLGYDWHPECLRCEECGKRLNPGQHAEHKGVPYCHVPCYGALFGPQLFGHGTRVESHTSFGKKEPRSTLPRSHLENKLKLFNQYYEGKSGGIRSREVNGRLILEGALRIYWGVRGVIHLKEDDDQRTVVTARNRNSCRKSVSEESSDEDEKLENPPKDLSPTESQLESEPNSLPTSPDHLKSLTLPMKLDVKNMELDELDELLQVERKVEDGDKLYQTMPENLPSLSSHSSTDTPPLSKQSSVDSSDKGTASPQKNETSMSNTPTHSIDSSSGTDTPNFQGTPNRNGTLRRVEYFDSLEKSASNNRSISNDDSWIEKGLNRSMSGPDCLQRNRGDSDTESESNSLQFREDDNMTMSTDSGLELDGVVLRRKQGSTAIRRRPGGRRQSRGRLRRRCSINGHFYNRETSFFTPPHGSQMSVWVTSLVSTQEVINLMLDKYKVDAKPANFALFVVRDNGEQRRLREDEYPLEVRVVLGPHENVARLFLVDKLSTPEISSDVAQFLNLSLPECHGILQRYHYEEERQILLLKEKYKEMRRRIKQRMEDLKVRL